MRLNPRWPQRDCFHMAAGSRDERFDASCLDGLTIRDGRCPPGTRHGTVPWKQVEFNTVPWKQVEFNKQLAGRADATAPVPARARARQDARQQRRQLLLEWHGEGWAHQGHYGKCAVDCACCRWGRADPGACSTCVALKTGWTGIPLE